MKKLSAILISVVLAAASAVSAFAAGINSSEQAVLDELSKGVSMSDGVMYIPDEYINQAESYFNTIDMTEEESEEIIAVIKQGESFLESSGASNIRDLTFEQKEVLLGYGEKAVAVLGMSMSYDFSAKILTIYGADGEVAFNAAPTLTKDGTVVENPIKTTGVSADFMGFAVLGAALVVLTAGGTIFVLKTKKERA